MDTEPEVAARGRPGAKARSWFEASAEPLVAGRLQGARGPRGFAELDFPDLVVPRQTHTKRIQNLFVDESDGFSRRGIRGESGPKGSRGPPGWFVDETLHFLSRAHATAAQIA